MPPTHLKLPFEPFDDSDFTYYVDPDKWATCLRAFNPEWAADEGKRDHYDLAVPLEFESAGYGKGTARLHAVRCFGRSLWSVTLRGLARDGQTKNEPEERPSDWYKHDGTRHRLTPPIIGWDPSKCLAPVDALTDTIFDQIFCDGQPTKTPIHQSGLVLFTGATSSAKTTYLNSVLNMYLKNAVTSGRSRAHVVVVGDPIETVLLQDIKGGPVEDIGIFQKTQPSGWHGVNFTAREIGKDVDSVRQATKDALRETPTAFVIGELRDRAAFSAALEFAGTGHLVFATSHSTNLVDAMDKLLRYTNTSTASGRATIGNQLRAIIHHRVLHATSDLDFKRIKPNDDNPLECVFAAPKSKDIRLNVPSLWIANSHGQRNLVAEGLSSLVSSAPKPAVSSAAKTAVGSGVLGRFWIANNVLNKLKSGDETQTQLNCGEGTNRAALMKEGNSAIQKLAGEHADYFAKEALKLDLRNE